MKGQSCEKCSHYRKDNPPQTRCFAWGYITETGDTCELGESLIENESLQAELTSLTVSYAGEFAKVNMILDKQLEEIESLKSELAKAKGES